MDGDHWPPIGNRTLGVDPKGQGRDPIIFEAEYLNNRAR